MKIRVLFYKAEWDGHLLDDAISSWTWIFNMGTGPYSHAEIWMPATNGSFSCSKCGQTPAGDCFHGTCYTSTMRDDINGVVKRPAAQVLRHPSRWSYVEIEVDEQDYKDMVRWMDLVVETNPGYDVWCILSFFWFRRKYHGEKYICSEFCHHALCWTEVFGKVACPSPRRLSRWLVDKGYKIKSLGE